MARRVEGDYQFGNNEDDKWQYEFNPLDPEEGVYEGIELDILLCIDSKNEVGMSLAEIIECLPQHDIAAIGDMLQEMVQDKTLNQFKGRRYFIGFLKTQNELE